MVFVELISVFGEGEKIPQNNTCDGDNVNPEIKISGVPDDTKSLALIVDDPDSPSKVWVHWALWNISPDTREIKESSVPQGAREGINDFGNIGYGGPCPQSGTHKYRFTLYALNSLLELSESSTREELDGAMSGHVIEKATLTGIYEKGK